MTSIVHINNQEKYNIVLLPPFGCNSSVYEGFEFDGHNVVKVDYSLNRKKETTADFLTSLIAAYKLNKLGNLILVGISMGGMLAIELDKKLHPVSTIIISSIKNKSERPFIFKILSAVPILNILRPRLLKKSFFIAKPFLDRSTFQFFKKSLLSLDNEFVDWSANFAINWKNDYQPKNLVHIHGTSDRLFPIHRISDPIKISNGSHSMIRTHMKQINEIVVRSLNLSIENKEYL